MKKRLFSILFSIILVMSLVVGCGSKEPVSEETGETVDEKVYELNLHSHDPEVSATGQFLNDWAAQVKEKSEGRLIVNVFHGGTLGGPKDTVDMVRNGTADIGWGLQSFFAGNFPVTEVFSLPMLGITSAVQGSNAIWEFYSTTDFMEKEYSEFHTLFLHTNCDSPISTVDKKIETVSDIKGMQVRANSGPPTAFVQNLGGNPVAIAIGEVYSSLEKGVIDGLITDWHAIKSFKFFEQANFYLNEHINVSTYFMLMNQAKYDSLPKDLQKILDEASGEAAIEFTGAWDQYQTDVMKTIEDNGDEIYTLSDSESAKLKAVADKTTEEWIASVTAAGYDGQAIYDKAKALVDKYAK